jgi:E3 ubiquitin-protein ligase RNF115/126
MANYLMALLGHTEPGMFGMPENGRMGDYVFNQEALDQIISQIMENSNAHRPVPAPEEAIAKLPREVLMEGCKYLHVLKSCRIVLRSTVHL